MKQKALGVLAILAASAALCGVAKSVSNYTPMGAIRLFSSLVDSTPIGSTTPSTGAFTTLTAAAISGPLTGNVTGNLTGNVTGNASGTASALAANPSGQCTPASQYATGIQANGNANCQAFTGREQGVRAAGCVTGASDGAVCVQTLDWPAAWPDTNYTVGCIGISPFNSGSTSNPTAIILMGAGSKTTTTINVETGSTGSAGDASFGEIDCIGIHD